MTTTYAYDDFGRRTSESTSAGETTYTWNSLGRLTGIESDDTTSTYEYGPTGMREKAVVVSAEATTTTECVWAGGSLAASRVTDTRETRDGVTTTVTDYRFLHGPSGLPLELIVTLEGGTPVAYTYQCDRAGSVIALTDSTGAAVATYTYDPWGEPLEAPTTGIGERNPLRYRGYYFDDATGLYYLPARYYDPATARFLSPDPASPSAGDPLTLNRYAYCVGDPVNARPRTSGVVADSGSPPAWLDAAQDGLAVSGVGLSLAAGACYLVGAVCPTAAPIAASVGTWLWGASAVCAVASCGLTYYEYSQGWIDGESASVSYGLSLASTVPFIGIAPATGGLMMEVDD